MGRISDQFKQHLERLQELDRKQQQDIERLLKTTRKLIDELPTYDD